MLRPVLSTPRVGAPVPRRRKARRGRVTAALGFERLEGRALLAGPNQPPVLSGFLGVTVQPGTSISASASATDPDPGQTLAYSLGAGAPAGSTIDAATGEFQWTAPQTPGDYVVTVIVTDDGTPPLSDSESFTISVVGGTGNRPPVLDPIGDQSIAPGATLAFTATASDPDTGQLHFFDLGLGAPPGAAIDVSTGAFTWSVPAGQAPGDYSITVRVTDSGLLSDFETLTIHVTADPPANQAPVLTPIPDLTVPPGTPVDVSTGASDPDPGQTLTYSLDPGAPPGATIDAATGELKWTAAPTYGDYAFTVRVTDNGTSPLDDSQTFTVHVVGTQDAVNHPPVLSGIPSSPSVPEGTLFTFTATATDPDAGDHLTFSLAPGGPAGASIDPNSGLFAFSSTIPGLFTFTVQVSDDGSPSLTDSKIFSLFVMPVPPTVNAGPNAAIAVGASLARPGSFTDPGAGPWTATVDYGDGLGNQPLTLSGKGFQLQHVYTRVGAFVVTVTVTDPGGASGSSHFTARVRTVTQADFNADGTTDVGVYQPNNDRFLLDFLGKQGQSVGQTVVNYGFHTGGVFAIPLVGDFNGDGKADVGIYQPNKDLFALDYLDGHGRSVGQAVFHYGFHTGGVFAVPLVGDFNGDGTTDVGIYQPNKDFFALNYLNFRGGSLGQAVFHYGFHTGRVNAVPLVGDFNGDGTTDVGIYQPNNDFFALNYLGQTGHSVGQAVFNYGFHTGGVNAVPLTGDFNGDGMADVGIYQPNKDFFALDYLDGHGGSAGQAVFNYGFHTGRVNAVPLVGDFNGDGTTDVGIYQPNKDFFALNYLGQTGHSVGQAVFHHGTHTGGVLAVPLPGTTTERVASTAALSVPPAVAISVPQTASATIHDLALEAIVKDRRRKR